MRQRRGKRQTVQHLRHDNAQEHITITTGEMTLKKNISGLCFSLCEVHVLEIAPLSPNSVYSRHVGQSTAVLETQTAGKVSTSHTDSRVVSETCAKVNAIYT